MPFDIETAKQFFFDRAAVEQAVDRGTRRALSKFGAFVRQRARTSIRKRKGISKPGSPPSSHEGSLRKLILFAYDPAQKSVVIGPTLYKRGEAPALLEYGGVVTRKGGDGRTRQLYYRPRPYMNPAFKAELPKAPLMFASMIR
jgi:hypothetical protein